MNFRMIRMPTSYSSLRLLAFTTEAQRKEKEKGKK